MRRIVQILMLPDKILALLCIGGIKVYQKTISPDHSWVGKLFPYHGCKHYPTCSDYAVQILKKRGFVRSLHLIIGRVLRCNPYAKGGVDLPPD